MNQQRHTIIWRFNIFDLFLQGGFRSIQRSERSEMLQFQTVSQILLLGAAASATVAAGERLQMGNTAFPTF